MHAYAVASAYLYRWNLTIYSRSRPDSDIKPIQIDALSRS